ncbi:MAG: SPOR domain-containing protein [Alphaproteobacteria bacterium]
MAQPVRQYDEYEERDGGFELVGEQRDEEPSKGGRRLAAIALTLAVMVLFAGGLWFAYVQGMRHADGPAAPGASAVPLLRAEAGPLKVRPEQPGGMPVPDQNISLYNERLAKAPVEKLLPPPEQPLPRPAPAPITPVAAPPVPMPPPEPNPAAAGSAQAVAVPRGQALRITSAATAPAETGSGIAPPQTITPQTAAPQPAQKAAVAAPAEPASGTVQVRLGSLRSPEAAREEWQRLKRVNADLLAHLRANAVSIDLGEKGIYYRIMAGPLDDAAAERLCDEMKRRNHGCIVAR